MEVAPKMFAVAASLKPWKQSHRSGSLRNFPLAWWHHQMETFSALLAIRVGNSPVLSEFPAQRPVTWSFDVFFDRHLNKRLSKQSWSSWFEMLSCPLWCHCNGLKGWCHHFDEIWPLPVQVMKKIAIMLQFYTCDISCVFLAHDGWCYEMEALCALLALCEGNPPVTGIFPSQKASNAALRCFFWCQVSPIYYIPVQRSCCGVYWFHSVRPSIRPSVLHPVSTLKRLQFWLDPFHIYTSYEATSEGVLCVQFLEKISKFEYLANFCYLQLWLCFVLTWNLSG